jgi:uncharacterized membrane protein YeiH
MIPLLEGAAFSISTQSALESISAITANYAWGVLHYHPISVILLAALTSCAGGIVRDVIIQKPTVVLRMSFI